MQQKAAAAKKEAEAREAARAAAAHKVHFPLANLKQKREAHGADRIDGANIEKLKAEAVKHVSALCNLNLLLKSCRPPRANV